MKYGYLNKLPKVAKFGNSYMCTINTGVDLIFVFKTSLTIQDPVITHVDNS